METKLIDRFNAGQMSGESLGAIPLQGSRKMLGCYPFGAQSKLAKGKSARTVLSGMGGTAVSIFKYRTITRDDWVYSTVTAGVNLFVFNATMGSTIYTNAGGVSSYPADARVSFEQQNDRLYFQEPKGYLWNWWFGINGTNQAERANWNAPVPPGVTLGGAGGINVNAAPVKYAEWVATWVLSSGTETNASTPSARLVPAGNLVTVNVAWDLAVGAPYQVGANIYRRGGSLGDFVWVGYLPNPGGGAPNSNFVDTLPDADASATRFAPHNNFPAPQGLEEIFLHQSRLFAFSRTGLYGSISANTLWFSGINMPGVWGLSQDGLATEGGYITLEGPTDDSILACASMGTVLVIGRQRSVYVLFGNNFREFILSKRSGVGIYNKHCLVRGYNEAYFIGADMRVYRVGESDPGWISREVQEDLDGYLTGQTPMLSFSDGALYVVISGQRTLAYRVADGAWYEMPAVTAPEGLKYVRQPYSAESRDDIVYLNNARTDIVAPFNVNGASSAVNWRSAEMSTESGDNMGKHPSIVENIYIDGDLTVDMGDAGRLKLVVYYDTGSRTYDIATGAGTVSVNGTLADFRPHGDVMGRYVAVALEGNAIALKVRSVRVALTRYRTTP